jgi:hypothetical protein
MKIKHLDKFCISFKEKLTEDYIVELNKYDNVIWSDGIDEFWATEMQRLLNTYPADYYYIWEEDSYIFDNKSFEETFEEFVKNTEIDFMITQDNKWIERANHLLNNDFALEDDNFIYFNWGTKSAEYCRKSSGNPLVSGAYPVTVSGIFTKELLNNLLDTLLSSEYWKDITKGNFNHFHRNPKLPHSFEVFPGFWWDGINDGYGDVEYTTIISKKLYGEELGDRLVTKLRKDTINIVGYDDWYTQKPWCREEINKEFKVTYNQNSTDLTYFIKDGLYKVNEIINPKTKVALLTECRLMDSVRYKFVEDNSNLFDYIVTYDDKLIEKFKEKVIITPYGGTWVWPVKNQKIHKKTKICSYICSNKNYTEDQTMRINILNYFYRNPHSNIELFGRGHNPLPENHERGEYDGKILALKDFAFSLVIENHVQDNYFSEKLLDCFLTGTIPIYQGCRQISNYFNTDGIITFKDKDDLINIIQNLNMEKYNKKLEIVKENFNLSKKYRDSVQYSYKKLRRIKNVL